MSKYVTALAGSPSKILVIAGTGLCLWAGVLRAGTMPTNLGTGLDALVEAQLQLKAARKAGTASQITLHNGYATKKAGNYAPLLIKDKQERILVEVHPTGIVPIEKLEKRAKESVPDLKIQATDKKYHGAGRFEAYVPLDDVSKLAGIEGVGKVTLTPKPIHAGLRKLAVMPAPTTFATDGEVLNEIGTVFDFGITQHRVDQINQTYNPSAALDIEGDGIKIGDLSDSFDTSTENAGSTNTTAAEDVASGDLPTVTVIQDYPDGTDEGRGMCQTLFKMAPKASLAFATADYGELQFADNIRSLAGLARTAGDPLPEGSPTFAADVIVDDVSYLDEPFFQDGIIAQAVDDVVAAGVSYFSSAANNPGTNGYDSAFNFESYSATTIPNPTGGVALALSSAPAYTYAGGLHNFNTSGTGTAVYAQTVNFPNSIELANYGEVAIPFQENGIPVVLQWNDPVDTAVPTLDPATPIDTFSGDTNAVDSEEPYTTDTTNTFQVTLTKGTEYYITETPTETTSSTPGINALDGQIEIYDSSGEELSFTDNNGSGVGEQVLFFPPTTGTYYLRVTAFQELEADDITAGAYTLNVYQTEGTNLGTENLNLLVFDAATGEYLSSSSLVGLSANDPIKFNEFVAPPGETQVVFVIARSTPTPTGVHPNANHFRYICFGDGIVPLGPATFFSYTTPLTFGHSAAAGANSVAAYPYYKPNIPEFFTSPGPVTVYYDDNNNYIGPTVRLKPDVAAMDGANTTFFGSDDDEDTDSSPNFFGTSDAAPHAAAIAALVLDANGGSRSVTPAQMKTILRASAFPHDLDPYRATGTARTTDGGVVNIIFRGDDEDSQITSTLEATGTAGIEDPDSIEVQYIGPGTLTSLVLNPGGTAATGGNVTDGVNGLTTPTTSTSVTNTSTYFGYPNAADSTPGVIFDTSSTDLVGKPFTMDSTNSSSGVTASAAVSNNDFTLTLTLTGLAGGDKLFFTIGREEYEGSEVTSAGASAGDSVANGSADIIGGGVSIPDGAINTQAGMTFSGTTSTGATFGFDPTQTSPGATSQTAYIRNRIGAGYSALDGFGFINAEAAVTMPLPPK
jgi:hypothetical protein